ncbi:HNH endonuclease [Pseudomonas cavernicola]|uniref:HNH endonuclease n=1 Tax=Pseudomonas cavernicola TaxID=2320866 RepID=A0A418XEG8_9PSED|nr:HNH endonuclease [Pseudomonas cavernicola]
MKSHICQQCAKPFKRSRSVCKFCSQSCYTESLKRRISKECSLCGIEFEFAASYQKKGPVLFCSRACYESGRLDRRPLEDRFWEKVEKLGFDDCWIWQGAKAQGYGKIWLSGSVLGAHRVSYEIVHGPIPEDMQINHKCDVRDCVNPNHLYVGTAKENTQDMIERNRGGLFKPGELHHSAKLNNFQVMMIRASSERTKDLALAFGINPDHVTRLQRVERWKSLPE